MSLPAGTRLGPYEVLSPLGRGGMGEVYRARDPRLRRDVAIKVLQEPVGGGAAWERFQREAHAASALSHPHICAVYDVGEADGRPYLVMELIEGQTLADYVNGKPLAAAAAVAIATQIADAVAAAHAMGVIHRDIKSSNIMITAGRHVKVLDFGLAKHVLAADGDVTRTANVLTEAGSVMGTLEYIAPELLQGSRADVRSDLWACGVVLYEMLSGHRPFQGVTVFDVSAAILRGTVPPLSSTVPAGLRAIVVLCLAPRPEDRYQRVDDLRSALEELHGPGVAASAARTRRPMWIAAAAFVLLIIAGVVVRQQFAPADLPRTVTGAPASANPEANDAFTLALQFMRVQNDFMRGQQQLERALALDPHFAEARRYHAFTYVLQILNGISNDASLVYKAEEELRQAEREDPTLASLPSAFAGVYLLQGRKDMIPAAALDQATVDASVARDAIFWQAIMFWLAGENERVKALTRRTLEREPLFGPARMFLGDTLRTEGDVPGAIREQLRVLEQAPANVTAVWFLTQAYLDANQLEQARTLLEDKRSLFERNFMWRTAWGLLLASEGKKADAVAAMDPETLQFVRSVFVATLAGAEFYALIGEPVTAVDWIETAVRNGDERVEWFRKNPRLATIQNDPRFMQILQSVEARKRASSGD